MRSADRDAKTIALIPLKSPAQAKSRLAGVLSPAQRRELLFALAARTVAALRETRVVDEVAVITACSEVATFAHALGASVLLQAQESGMCEAVAEGMQRLPQSARLLVIAGDLPLISAAALAPLLADADEEQAAMLVPDRHGRGTNVMLCIPGRRLTPCFGVDSLRLHLEVARAAGMPVRVMEHAALALDLDCADDVEELQRVDRAAAAALLQRLVAVEARAA